jgi:hypothetical protein
VLQGLISARPLVRPLRRLRESVVERQRKRR